MAERFDLVATAAVEGARIAFSGFHSVTAEATKTVEELLVDAHDDTLALGRQTTSLVCDVASLSLAHARAMRDVRSPAELFELQSAFLHRHVALSMAQLRHLQAAAHSAADRMLRPARQAREPAATGFAGR
ncbi:phasin family protein [Neorhizobium sp. NPDC001467]|uniref:phasin family protein n=1 Tax=Neorhizobium sp. NPDC001467 TaxID=3390595 RepID=UPI003D095727